MESAFAWLNQLFQTIYQFFPRILIIRATHGGVKWVRGKNVVALQSGLHFWWPLTTEVIVIVTARQTQSITDQYMVTKDRVVVGFDTLVVYRIPDVIKAVGRINWDVDTTVCDITQAAVATVIATRTYDELMQGMADGSLRAACTRKARKELRQFGVYVSQCKLGNVAPCRVYRFLTTGPTSSGLPTTESYD